MISIESLKQKTIEFTLKRDMNLYGKVYMLHHVAPGADRAHQNLHISVRGLSDFLDKQLQKQTAFKSLRDFDVENEDTFRASYITLDDIFKSAYENAIPVLREKAIPYTVFISPGLLGKPDYIGEAELKCLQKDPLCCIGYHSLSHSLARHENKASYKKEIDKSSLERILNDRVELFAFPFGSLYACPNWAIEMVKQEGFAYAFSTVNAALVPGYVKKHRYFVPRVNLNENNYRLFR